MLQLRRPRRLNWKLRGWAAKPITLAIGAAPFGQKPRGFGPLDSLGGRFEPQ